MTVILSLNEKLSVLVKKTEMKWKCYSKLLRASQVRSAFI